jgi:glycosyltransferase involved in cell wall biosynthesis
MHVVHFCGALKGGPLSAIAEWTRQQLSAGCEVTLIYSPTRDPLESFRDDLQDGIELVPLDVHREIHLTSDIAAIRKLARWLKQRQPDIIHLHSSKAGAIGRVSARLAGIPSIYSTHSISFLRTDVGPMTSGLFYAVEWLLGLVGDVTVACSSSELAAMRSIPGRKIVIPNGIDLAAIPTPPQAQQHDGLEIVLCGRITTQKNPQLACAIAGASPPEWRWTWLGGGDLEGIVRAHGRIAVAGWLPRTEVLGRLGAADVMVHTSSWEGMPIAILEGMALGLPVVTTDVVGNRDLVVSGRTGFVADDVASFLTALNTLAGSLELRRNMGLAGRHRVMAEFNQADLARRWMELYHAISAV